ncbi:glycosyltransferase family 4 protein [Paenibacillus aurantiacus]|uniref:Glycosyltransferase family 4 protein n=1 Tax=Paenibacillus aurantiacus TaxID=1936118 RepID=A0ABV5L3F4_9BACL
MKIAIVHDWLVTYAGSEKVLEQLIHLYPDADIFSTVDHLPTGERGFIKNKPVTTSFIQKLPMSKKKYRTYLPFMPLAVEQFDLSSYDLIISSSHAVAKGVITGPTQLHISYVHSPIRYAWDLQHQYLKESGLDKGAKGLVAKWMLHKMRLWDARTANGVDHFISNSGFIAKRIYKTYHREAHVIYPPVEVDRFQFGAAKQDYYLTFSRMVPYKKIDLIVEAFSTMPDKKLIVIGDGPDFNKVKSKAGPNVQLLGFRPTSEVIEYVKNARAYVFAAEEDFGISIVEAQSAGTPVIAYGRGGALEIVRGMDTARPTGIFFDEQTVDSIVDAVERFEQHEDAIDYYACKENAVRFSTERFRDEFKSFVDEKLGVRVTKLPAEGVFV